MLTAEEITENFNQFRDLLSKIGDRSESALKLVDHFGERLALCPASSKRSYHNSFAGGLVDHSLRVCKNAVVMMKSYCEQSEWKSMKDSVILTSLFHDIGKAGDLTNDYYVPAEEWRRQKLGEDYAVNENLKYMLVPHRSLWLCQHFNVTLSQEEYLAILLNDGMYEDANKKYSMKEPKLATIVHLSDLIATKQEKGQI
jgi:hypothetical protein